MRRLQENRTRMSADENPRSSASIRVPKFHPSPCREQVSSSIAQAELLGTQAVCFGYGDRERGRLAGLIGCFDTIVILCRMELGE